MLKFSQFLLIEDNGIGTTKSKSKDSLKTYRDDVANQIKDLGDLLKVSVGNRGEIERLKNEINMKQTELSQINTTLASQISPSAPSSDMSYLPEPDQALKKSALEKLSGSNIPGDNTKTTATISLGAALPTNQSTTPSASLPAKAPSLTSSKMGSTSTSFRL